MSFGRNKQKYMEVLDLTEKLDGRRWVVVGDIHGCIDELLKLLKDINFDYDNDYLISVGDLIDRGPDSLAVYSHFFSRPFRWFAVTGNHDERFKRYLRGNNVKLSHGLDLTITQFKGILDNPADRQLCLNYFNSLPYVIKTPFGYVVHAGFHPARQPEEQTREDCIFMRYHGGKDYFDNVNGKYWYTLLPNSYPNTFSGHEVHTETLNARSFQSVSSGGQKTTSFQTDWLLDGGCAFGGELRLWDSKDDSIHTVKAFKEYYVSEEDKAKRLERSKQHYLENENKDGNS